MFVPIISPGDYQAMLQYGRTERFRKMFKEEEATEGVDDGVKWGPCRKDLCELWEDSAQVDWEKVVEGDAVEMRKLESMVKQEAKGKRKQKRKQKQRGRKVKKLSKPARGARLTYVCGGLGRRLDGRDLQTWIQACGRYVGKTLGPVIWLKKQGFIRKLKERRQNKKGKWLKAEKRKAGEQCIDLKKAGGQGRWVTIPQQKVSEKVVELLEVADANPLKKKCIDSVAEVEAAQLCSPILYHNDLLNGGAWFNLISPPAPHHITSLYLYIYIYNIYIYINVL